MTENRPILFKDHDGREHNLLEINPNELPNLYPSPENIQRQYFWLPTRMPLSNSYSNALIETGQARKERYYRDYLSNSENHNLSDIHELSMRDSFLFCVFSDRSKQAKELCCHFKKPYMACLMAAKIYRRAARLIGCQNDKRCYYLSEEAEEYSRLAAEQIDQIHRLNCVNREPKELLSERDPTFFNYTAWELINRSYCRSIHESNVIRKYVQTIWYNSIDEDQGCIHFRVFLVTIFFPLIPLLLLIPRFIPFRRKPNWFERLKTFYSAPIVQFYIYYIFFIGFLMIHGYWIMMAYFPINRYGEIRAKTKNFPLTRSELITHVWIFHLIVEEILEFVQSYKRHRNCCSYFRRPWNCLDFIIIIIYLFALILRIPSPEQTFVGSKILMCFAFILWSIRLLRIFTIFKQLGWCLFLIFRMIKIFIFFFSFILINMFTFSIVNRALLITDQQVTWFYTSEGKLINATVADGGNGDGYELFDWIEIKKLFDWGIWKMFGNTDDLTPDYENSYTVVAWCLKIIYVCMTNIVLINTLIVLLNIIGDNTKQKSKILQRYEHFSIIMEFCNKDKLHRAFQRSLLPPPLNILWYIFRLLWIFICYLISLLSPQSNEQINDTENIFDLFKTNPYLLITYTCIPEKKEEEEEMIIMDRSIPNTPDTQCISERNLNINTESPNDLSVTTVSGNTSTPTTRSHKQTARKRK